jgi:parallel beta-helix repeat protein
MSHTKTFQHKECKIVLLILVAFAGSAIGKTIYVDAGASGGNGQSWETAYQYLQDALAEAVYGDEIWVGAGTYKPDEGTSQTTGDWSASFELVNGVVIYGGFPAGGGSWDMCDPQTNETILSGDLDDNDADVVPEDMYEESTRSENSCQVVTSTGVDPNTVLDGFTISDGQADESNPYYNGGGMYNESSSPTVSNCTFTANVAGLSGGGMYNKSASPTMINCTISGNAASHGGGICNDDNSNPALFDCIIEDNLAVINGGGIKNSSNCQPIIVDCTFQRNTTTEDVLNQHGGGGVYSYDSDAIFINCTFYSNSATNYGGGMFNSESNPILTNCVFSGNSALDYNLGAKGGGMYNNDSSPVLTNCTFSGNSAYYDGGGISNWYSSYPIITNCIVYSNTAETGPEIYDASPSITTITYSDIGGGWEGADNIDANPLFVDADGADDVVGTEDDDFRLLADSLCIDVADSNALPPDIADLDSDDNIDEPTPFDIRGRLRFVDGDGDGEVIVDMGAYEYAIPVCGDPDHPYPVGDITLDCEVNLEDLALLAEHWLECTKPEPGCG